MIIHHSHEIWELYLKWIPHRTFSLIRVKTRRQCGPKESRREETRRQYTRKIMMNDDGDDGGDVDGDECPIDVARTSHFR